MCPFFTSLCPTRWHVTVQRVDSPLKKHSTLCLMVTEVAWKKSFRSCSTIGSSKVRRRSHSFSHSRCFLHRRQMWMALRTHSPGYAHYPAHHRPMDKKQPAVCWIWQPLSFLIFTIITITINKTRINIFFTVVYCFECSYICFSIRFFYYASYASLTISFITSMLELLELRWIYELRKTKKTTETTRPTKTTATTIFCSFCTRE